MYGSKTQRLHLTAIFFRITIKIIRQNFIHLTHPGCFSGNKILFMRFSEKLMGQFMIWRADFSRHQSRIRKIIFIILYPPNTGIALKALSDTSSVYRRPIRPKMQKTFAITALTFRGSEKTSQPITISFLIGLFNCPLIFFHNVFGLLIKIMITVKSFLKFPFSFRSQKISAHCFAQSINRRNFTVRNPRFKFFQLLKHFLSITLRHNLF